MSKNRNGAATSTTNAKNLISANLLKLAENGAVKTASAKAVNQKSLLYNYPENFTPNMINGGEGKTFRSKCRKTVENFANKILFGLQQAKISKNAELLNEAIKNFDAYYKVTFKINDYSLQSITHKKENAENLKVMLEIVKESKK